ncbi:MAG: hypothetical protein KBT33_05475 [Prevotellaceae bacterium]|nr:hypothetical protein [Candidatus Minthosoma equi]
MKKTMKMMLALMAGAMVFTACSSDDMLDNNEVVQAPSQLKPMTFTAVQEGGTRTAIDGLNINWTAGDKISIFDGATENGGVQMFTLATGQGTTSATFTGSAADAATYYALYPYAVGETSRQATKADAEAVAGSAAWSLDSWKSDYERRGAMLGDRFFEMYSVTYELNEAGVSDENKAIVYAYIKGDNITVPGVTLDGSSIKNVVIPAEQAVAAGQTVDPNAMVMVAKGDDKDALEFKNVCAYVKVTPQFDCVAICLKSNGDQKIAGKVTVNYNEGNPTTTVTSDGSNEVLLAGTITAGNAYYIAVRPEALASGFTIEFLTADKATYYARSTSNTLNLTRSNVKNLGEFTTSGTWTKTIPTTGDDGNGHSWKLITPTFKMATSTAVTGNVEFADIPTTWGSDWVLPAADEFLAFNINGNVKKDGNNLKLCGEGILKYTEDIDISVGYYSIFWTSTPGASADEQKAIWTALGEVQDVSKTNPKAVIFKYTK